MAYSISARNEKEVRKEIMEMTHGNFTITKISLDSSVKNSSRPDAWKTYNVFGRHKKATIGPRWKS